MKNMIHTKTDFLCSLAACALTTGFAFAGPSNDPLNAYIIEGSGFFGAPGIELTSVGLVDLSDPSNVTALPLAGMNLRFGGADIRPGTSELVAFENTTNALRIIDTINGGNALIDSIGFMDSGVAGMTYSNDGSVIYVTATVGAFVRIVQADAVSGAVISVHNILTNVLTSLATVPEHHPTLTPGAIMGLSLTAGGSVRLVELDLDNNSIASETSVFGIGFNPQFETGLDFASDGTLYAVIQGYDEVSPDVFEEISSHLYTIDPSNGSAFDLGVIEGESTWDAVTLVIDEAAQNCLVADLNNDGELNFFDVSAFLNAFSNQDPVADFTSDGEFNFFDVSEFLAQYAIGCP
ncbi:MAG: GC-type dockerin domain-anchored protein [Phycisphaerales bacterium]|nr:GC-type dockerin domain-anchored protein [Phycisphaerales bacterium]